MAEMFCYPRGEFLIS